MRFGQWIGFFLVIISFYIVWQIRQILLIVFAAIVLATVLNNFVTFLQRLRVKRSIAIFITITLLLLIIFGFFIVI
ncbi:MAG: AI-2E family transporter, partial [Trichormus sp.]